MMTNTVPDNQLEFDLGEGEEEIVVDLGEEESPEKEKKEAAAPAPAAEAPASDAQKQHSDELDNVSENVQRRISKLTAKMREAERREQAALEYARSVQAKAQELEQKLVVTDTSRLNEAKSRMETQTATLKAIIKRAREEGDIDTETEAQERLMELAYEQRQVRDWLEQQQAQPQQAQPQQAQPQAAPRQQPQQQAPAPSPKADAWAAKNEWFGKDKTMTYAAWGIHATMVDEEGFDPESDEYYTELDNRIRQEFPHRFQSASQNQQRQRQNVPAVAPAARSSGISSARRSVKLSPSQIAIAKKLGVPLEEYAKYVKE
jgi:hypothetical protein